MSTHKKEAFLQVDQDISAFAQALSHPARLAILRLLAEREECICGEIVELLPLAQSTVSQHLKALKNAGLVQGSIDGPRSCYCIDHNTLSRAATALDELLGTLKEGPENNCC